MNSILKRITQVEAPPPWGMGAAALTFFAAFLAIIAGTLFAFSIFNEAARYREIIGWTISMALIVALVLQTRRSDRAALKLQPPDLPLPVILLIAFGFAVTIDLIGLAITRELRSAPELLNIGAPDALGWLFIIAFMLIAQPIAEELVFRGVLFPVLRTLTGAWGGLALSALVYGLFHLLAYPPAPGAPPVAGLWYGLAQPLLAGLVIGALRAYTGSTRAAIIAHAAFGLFALLKLFVVAS
jgi:membrane protease YdiL (CAAX protease family)